MKRFEKRRIIVFLSIIAFLSLGLLGFGCGGGGGGGEEAPGEPPAEEQYPKVSITSPTVGETINKANIIVSGTVESETTEVGVRVNGILADVQTGSAGSFAANDVPLVVGSNTITATAIDPAGNQAEHSITVYTDEISEPVTLSGTPSSGIAPLDVTFSIMTFTENDIAQYEMDFEGDGIVDYSSTTALRELSHTYTTEALHLATLVITDTEGNQFSDSFCINVHPVPPLDQKWDGMKSALQQEDIEGALDNFTDQSKDRYREIFNILGDDLAELSGQMQGGDQIQLVYLKGDVAKYRIRREQIINGQPETITYYIYFVKDENGMWKIESF